MLSLAMFSIFFSQRIILKNREKSGDACYGKENNHRRNESCFQISEELFWREKSDSSLPPQMAEQKSEMGESYTEVDLA